MLVLAVNYSRQYGVPHDRRDYVDSDWETLIKLGQSGQRLPQVREPWENIALAEKPFGPDQAAIDAQAEAIQPQGRNAYLITGYSLIDGDVYVGYYELGGEIENSWMEIGQFAREFRLITKAQ